MLRLQGRPGSEYGRRGLLKRIADATGGTSYIARTPNDISGIFTTEITKWMKD